MKTSSENCFCPMTICHAYSYHFPVHTHTVVIDIEKVEIGNACKSTPSYHEKF